MLCGLKPGTLICNKFWEDLCWFSQEKFLKSDFFFTLLRKNFSKNIIRGRYGRYGSEYRACLFLLPKTIRDARNLYYGDLEGF